jgi:4-methyl-5(b-hydroxyethyl)-thiazole monophosphate biosynthesis
MPRVLVPLAEGFEEIEALAIVDVLRRAEIEVVVAGLHPGPVTSARKISVLPDTTIDAVNSEGFDMIILPGGQPGTDNLNNDPRIHRLLADFQAAGRLIGAICAAPIILAAAGLLAGKRATSYPGYSTKLAGAVYEDQTVVTDGHIMTSQGPGTAISFALAVVTRLSGEYVSEAVTKSMLVHDAHGPDLWDQRLFNSTIQALVGALEIKDTYSQGQAKRVAEYSLCIGAKLGLSKTEMRDLYLGAMLHDIGKYSTAENVLNKPDSLNLHEETISREHTLKGTLFVVGIDNLDHICPTILHHHERWDGSGYPAQLKGEQIPLHARIVGLTDSFDAMVSARSYRPALSRDTAVRELQKHKGTLFDPFLVDVFIECLNDSPYEMKDFSYYF